MLTFFNEFLKTKRIIWQSVRLTVLLIYCGVFCVTPLYSQKNGTISGKITLRHPDEMVQEILKERALIRYSLRHAKNIGTGDPYGLSEKAIIYIEPFKSEVTPPPPATHPQLRQKDLLFRPLVLPVIVGTTVDFPNSDDLFHNVFSYSQPKEFDLGRYPKGQSKSMKFDKPGVVNVFCDIHSYMFATILVLSNPYYTIPDDDGNYAIPDIPPGSYQVSFWYGRKKIESKNIDISAGGNTTINFAF